MAVITLACGKLTVTTWGSAEMPLSLIPHNFASSLFPKNMFPTGTCFPKADIDGKAAPVSSMDFTQKDGVIQGFKWSSKRGRNLVFERSEVSTLVKLAEPDSPLLRLPGELRNKIYSYLYEDKEIKLIHYGDKTRFATSGEKEKAKGHEYKNAVRLDAIKDTCKQLYQETKGIYLPKAHITTIRKVFAKFIERKDPLLHGRTRNVTIIKGFDGLLRRRNVALVLFPIIDFCKANPQVSVRIWLDDLVYDPHDPIAFIRTGMLLRKAFRGERKFCFKKDKKAMEELRGGRRVEELDMPNMRLLSAYHQKFEDHEEFRRRVGILLKSGNPDAKKVMKAYGGDMHWMIDDVLRMFQQGM